MTFSEPLYLLWLLLLVPYILWHFLWRHKQEASMTLADTAPLRHAPSTWRTRMLHAPFWLRILTFTLVVLVLSRPQTHNSLHKNETEGIDIMMALDISTSMMTPDIRPNRMTAAKEVAVQFISARSNDNIGLTLFGGEAFTQCPLTTDHTTLLSMFKHVSCDLQAEGVIQPGTAIGMGLATAVSHLRQSKSKSKVIILLTDGENNTGDISPLTAADIARDSGIRVYTILLGTNGRVSVPMAQLPNGEVYETQMESTADPTTLRQIATATGGTFYKAASRENLRRVYADIDKLEKTKLKVTNYNRRYEAYQPLALAAFISLLLEILLRFGLLRRLP